MTGGDEPADEPGESTEREAWAIVTEAAACGLPLVLAGAAGASHDLLQDGRNGILVQPGRVEQASAARPKCRVSATITTYRRCRSSMSCGF